MPFGRSWYCACCFDILPALCAKQRPGRNAKLAMPASTYCMNPRFDPKLPLGMSSLTARQPP
jgi:hypothetical protein